MSKRRERRELAKLRTRQRQDRSADKWALIKGDAAISELETAIEGAKEIALAAMLGKKSHQTAIAEIYHALSINGQSQIQEKST